MPSTTPGWLFEQLGKRATGVLDDDYVATKKFFLKTTTPNDVVFVTEAQMTGRLVLATLGARYRHPSGLMLDRLEMKTDGRVLGEASLAVDERLKFTVSAEDGRQERKDKPSKSYGKLGMEFVSEHASVTGEVDVVNGPLLGGSLLLQHTGYMCGGSAQFNTQLDEKNLRPGFTDVSAGVGYRAQAWQAAAVATGSLSDLNLSFFHQVNESVAVGAKMVYGISRPRQALAVGCAVQLDQDARLRSKVDSDAVVSLAFAQRLGPFATLTLGAQLDAKDLGGPTTGATPMPGPAAAAGRGGDPHKFGMSLTLEL